MPSSPKSPWKALSGGISSRFVIAFFLMALVYYTAVKKNFPREERRAWPRLESFKEGILALFAPIVILAAL